MSTNGSEPLNWRNKRETEVELAQKYGIDPVPDKNRMPKSGEKNEVAGRKSPDDYVSFRPKNTDDKENVRGRENRIDAASNFEEGWKGKSVQGSNSSFVRKHTQGDRGQNRGPSINPFQPERNREEADSGSFRTFPADRPSRSISRNNSLLQQPTPLAPDEVPEEKSVLQLKAEREGRGFETRRRRILTEVLSKLNHFRTNGVSRQRTKEYLLSRFRDKLHYPFSSERDLLTLQVLIEILYEELDSQIKTNEKDRLWVEMHKSDVNNLSDKDKANKILQLQKEIREMEELMRQKDVSHQQTLEEVQKQAWFQAEQKQMAQDKEILHLQTLVSRFRGDRDLFDKYWETLCLLFGDLDEWILSQAVELQDERLEPLRERIQRAGQFSRWAKDYTLSGDERKFFEDREWIRRQEIEKREWALMMEFKDLSPLVRKPQNSVRKLEDATVNKKPEVPALRLHPSTLRFSPDSQEGKPSQQFRSSSLEVDSFKEITPQGSPPRRDSPRIPARYAASGNKEPVYHSLASAASAQEFSQRMAALGREELLQLCNELGETIQMLRVERSTLCDRLFEAIDKLKARLFDCCAIIEALGKASTGRLREFWDRCGTQLVNDLLSGVTGQSAKQQRNTPGKHSEHLSGFKLTTPLKSQPLEMNQRSPSPGSQLQQGVFDYGESIANAQWVKELLRLQQSPSKEDRSAFVQSQSPGLSSLDQDGRSGEKFNKRNSDQNQPPIRMADVRLTSEKKQDRTSPVKIKVNEEEQEINLYIQLTNEKKGSRKSKSEEPHQPSGQKPDQKKSLPGHRKEVSPLSTELEMLLIENNSLKVSVDRLSKLIELRGLGRATPNTRSKSRESLHNVRNKEPAPDVDLMSLLAVQACTIERLLLQVP